MTMELIVNGSSRTVAAGILLVDLIEQMQLGGRRLAVELNGDVLPRSQYPNTTLADGDRLEIVQAIGGG